MTSNEAKDEGVGGSEDRTVVANTAAIIAGINDRYN